MSLTLVQGYDSDNDERMLRERREEDVLSDDEEEREGDGEAEGEGEGAGASGRGSGNQEPTNGHNGSGGSSKRNGPRPAHRPPPPVPAPKVGKTGLPSASFAFDEVSGVPDFLRPAALVSAPALSRAAASVAGITGAHTSAPVSLRSSEGASGSAYPVPSGGRFSGAGDVRAERESRGTGPEQGKSPGADASTGAGAGAGAEVRKVVGAVMAPAGREESRQGGTKKRDKEGGVKDKEKLKRMKGQSSHATWKSETEMQLRQTYD